MQSFMAIGRTTADPQLRYTPNGKAVLNYDLAVDREGGKNRETDFIPCVIWEEKAKLFADKVGKGSLIAVTGQLQTHVNERDGKKFKEVRVVTHSVKWLDIKKAGSGNESETTGNEPK